MVLKIKPFGCFGIPELRWAYVLSSALNFNIVLYQNPIVKNSKGSFFESLTFNIVLGFIKNDIIGLPFTWRSGRIDQRNGLFVD